MCATLAIENWKLNTIRNRRLRKDCIHSFLNDTKSVHILHEEKIIPHTQEGDGSFATAS